MQTVTLLGDMGDKFGHTWTMNVDYVGDIFKLISCQRPGFKQYLMECHENGVGFEIKRGEEFIQTEEELLLSVDKEDFIVTPMPAGSKSGAGKIIAAIVFIIIAIIFPPAWAASGKFGAAVLSGVKMMAVSLALQGIAQLLMPGPETDDVDPASYLFSGAQTAMKEGLPVPLLYGELIVGGAVMNQSFTSKSIQAGDMKLAPNPEENAGDYDTSEPDDETSS